MKRHAPMGADILSVVGFPYPVVPIVRHHHENWNGSGYPDGLSGEEIPIGARILSVVDCFDALTSDRPYRPRLSDEEALQIVRDRRGSMYDPRIVDEFFVMYAEGVLAEESAGEPPPFRAPAPAAPASAPAPGTPDLAGGDDLLEMFYRLGGEIAATMRAQDVGEIVWRHVASYVPAASFVMFAYDVDGDALVPLFRSDDRVIARDGRIPVGERLSGWVAATGQTIVNSDARLDQDACAADARPLRSALAAPVVRGDRVTAVLAFYADEPEAFAVSHRRIAEAAARSIATVPLEVAMAELAAANAA